MNNLRSHLRPLVNTSRWNVVLRQGNSFSTAPIGNLLVIGRRRLLFSSASPRRVSFPCSRYMSSSPTPNKDPNDNEGENKRPEENLAGEDLDKKSSQKALNDEYNENIVVQSTFSTFFGRLGTVWQGLMGPDGEKQAEFYKSLTEKHHLAIPYTLHSFLFFSDLLNPLLVKYKFDVVDFAEGVKLAYPAVKEAASLVLDSTIYPDNYKDKMHEIDEQRRFLQETLGDRMLKYLQISAKEMELFQQMHIKFDAQRHSNLIVTNVMIDRVYTRVVEPDDTTMHQETMKGPVIELTEQMDPHLHQKRQEKRGRHGSETFIDKQRKEDLRRYRPGSVVVSVDVYIESKELETSKTNASSEGSSNSSEPSTTVDNNQKEATKKPIVLAELWRFEGCISGHVPLNWLVMESHSSPMRIKQ